MISKLWQKQASQEETDKTGDRERAIRLEEHAKRISKRKKVNS